MHFNNYDINNEHEKLRNIFVSNLHCILIIVNLFFVETVVKEINKTVAKLYTSEVKN